MHNTKTLLVMSPGAERGHSTSRKTIFLAMKLTILFLIAGFLHVSGKGFSQEITFSAKNAPLEKVFLVIKRQTNYTVIYEASVVKNAKAVGIDARKMPLKKFLEEILADQLLEFTIENTTIIISKRPAAKIPQPEAPMVLKPIRGRVVNEKGEPVEGVTVTVKGTSIATATNMNGEYQLADIPANATLVFSSAGYSTQTLNAGNRDVVNVEMAIEVNALSEIVVTAFGIERNKKALGYSAQVVKGSELTEARETNVANSLKGKVAGVFVSPSNTGPGGSTFINIRGASSLKGNNQPLYVVDGVPIDNQTINGPDVSNDKGLARDYGDGIGNISPDDIESVTVLKGPNAAALYGSRGATGVILITTKKGKSGKRAGVDFNSNATFETLNTLPVYQKVWGPGYDNDFSAYSDVTVDGQPAKQFPDWTGGESYGAKFDGSNVVLQTWPSAGILKYAADPADRVKEFYQTGSTFTNTVGVSGGSDKANYRLSVSDLRNQGIYPTSSLKRQTINLRAGYHINNNLYVEGKINYIRQKGVNRPGNGVDFNTLQTALTRAPAFLSMDLLKDYKTEDGQANNWTDGRPFNPYWILNEFLSNDSRDRIIGYVLARYEFTKWLSLQVRSGTDFYSDIRFARIGFNTPTGYSNLRKGQVNNDEINVKEENSDFLLTASGNLSTDFTGSFSVGGNHLNRRQESLSIRGNNLNIPGIYNIINAGLVFPSNDIIRKKINSGYFTGQVGYRNYLFLDVSGRNDWSSTLGVNNYSFFYPSVSTSLVFTEAFNMTGSKLSFGKIRASYAQAGNDASPYLTQIGYRLLTSTYNGQQFAAISNNAPLLDLKNELTGSLELGAELRFFNNRLALDFTYYNSSTKNQILAIDIPAATGFNTKLINAGEIRNKGVEILLTGSPVRSQNFNWDVTINFSRNRSNVVALAPGIESLVLGSIDNGSIEARPGLPYGNIVGYAFKRNENGQLWVSEDSRTYQQEDSLSVLGNIQPDFLAGITNSITFKGITLSALIDMRVGGEIYSNSKLLQTTGGSGKFTENGDNLVAEGVYMDADGKFQTNDQVIGRMQYYTAMGWGGITEYFVLPADYVALREVSLGYEIGKHLQKTPFKSAKLSVVGRNLFYIYRDPQFKTMGISPESAYGPTAVAQGYENPGTPSTRSMGINLSFSF